MADRDAVSPARAACEAFWAAIGAGPDGQEPGAAWRWAQSQRAEGAWGAAAAAAIGAARRSSVTGDQARADRGDYAARLKATAQIWARLAVERDELAEQLAVIREWLENLAAGVDLSASVRGIAGTGDGHG